MKKANLGKLKIPVDYATAVATFLKVKPEPKKKSKGKINRKQD